MGVTLHKHYCMGHLRNIAFMHKAEPCQNEGDMDMPFDCCKDTVEEFKVEELNKASFAFDVTPELHLLYALDYFIVNLDLQEIRSQQTDFLNYKPPLIERDIIRDVQSILC